MKHITIDNLEHIPESATFQDLRYLHGTGRSKTSIGAYGRKHSDYRFGAQTEIGDIEISVWEAAMHRLIRNSGEEALYSSGGGNEKMGAVAGAQGSKEGT